MRPEDPSRHYEGNARVNIALERESESEDCVNDERGLQTIRQTKSFALGPSAEAWARPRRLHVMTPPPRACNLMRSPQSYTTSRERDFVCARGAKDFKKSQELDMRSFDRRRRRRI